MSLASAAPHGKRRFVWRACFRTATRWLLALTLAAWLALLLAWVVLKWGILPHIDYWRVPIERQASKALGLEVHIAHIDVVSSGLIPSVNLSDVRLSDAQGHEVLRLPRVQAALSPRSVLALQVRFEQLLLDGPELAVRRDAQGRIHVGGLQLAQTGATQGADLTDWLLHQRELAIRHGAVRWTDELSGAPALALQNLDFVLRNGLTTHALRVDATPPAAWGERFSLAGRFTHSLLRRASDFEHWSGNLYASLPRADVRELRRHVHLPFELSEGDGALRAWFELERGHSKNLTIDLALRAVKLRLSPELETLNLERIAGRLNLQHANSTWGLQAEHLSFATDKAQVFAATDLALSLHENAQGALDAGDIQAQRLDLTLLAQLASKLPLGGAVNKLLAELAPKGQLLGLQAQWSGPLDAPKTYKVQAQLLGLSLAAKAASNANNQNTQANPHAQPDIGRPGLQNANLQLTATDTGGAAQLTMSDGWLEFPGVFEDAKIPMQRLSAALQWRIAAPAMAGAARPIELNVTTARFANADAEGELSAIWRTGGHEAAPGNIQAAKAGRGARYPGVLDMHGKLLRAQALAVPRYLPLGIPADTRSYLRHALLAGVATDVTFKVRGDLWDFPFSTGAPNAAGAGEFRIALHAKDVVLAYVPSHAQTPTQSAFVSPWPAMENVSGDIVFDHGGMQLAKARGTLLGYELSGVHGSIDDLSHAVLVLQGEGKGPLPQLLEFMRRSPVGAWTGDALKQSSGTGEAELKLALRLPLSDIEQSSVKGSVQLRRNDLRLRPDLPIFGQARAHVAFTHKDLQISDGHAQVMGGELAFAGGSSANAADKALRFTGQGVATSAGLRAGLEWPLLARVATSLEGQAPYRLQVAVHGAGVEYDITSNMQGMASKFPAPLAKPADTSMLLHLQNSLLADSKTPAQQDQLLFELGGALQARYVRDISGPSAHVLRGVVAYGEPAPALPSTGVQAVLNLPVVELDQWSAQAKKLMDAGESADAQGALYLPTSLAIRAQELNFGGRRLSKVVASARRVDSGLETGTWRSTLDSEQISGYIELAPRNAASGLNAGMRVYARLAHAALRKTEVQSVQALLDQQPSSLPSLDVVVDDFELRGKHLGRLELKAQANLNTRDWLLERLQLSNPHASLLATGSWKPVAGAARRRTSLDLKLVLADSGATLDRLGFVQVLRSAKGSINGQLSWSGSPFEPDYASMSGQLNLALEKGQFLKVEPGAGRLLGVLSMQSLPRRLALDFRDVFDEGFAFDAVNGDVSIKQGIMQSNNLRMQGLAASVLIEGQADLMRETQDLHVVLVPDVNAGGASLAYAVVNPILGFSTFLAQWLLRKPLSEANTREFRVTGRFDAPKVEPITTPAAPLVGSAASAPQ